MELTFETATLVFDDPHALSFVERIVNGEERWQSFGALGNFVVMVAHTWFDDNGEDVIRIISARKATAGERDIYEAHKKSG